MNRWLWMGCVTVSAACASADTATPRPVATQESRGPAAEDSVWAAVLDSLHVGSDARRLVVIDHASSRADRAEYIASLRGRFRSIGADSATVAGWWDAADDLRPVGPLPPTRLPVTLVSQAMVDSLQEGPARPGEPVGFWERFRARHPGAVGLVTLGPVGFNAARTRAVTNTDYGCGGLCGQGTVYLLERDATGRWRVVRSTVTWIS